MFISSQLLFFLLLLLFIFSTTASATVQNATCPAQIRIQLQEPDNVSTNYIKNQASTDQPFGVTGNTSEQLGRKLGGETGATTSSSFPWRQWWQKLSQPFHDASIQYVPDIYNSIVDVFSHASGDGLYGLQNWWQTPSLGLRHLQSSLVSLLDQCYYDFLNWYSGAINTYNEVDYHSNSDDAKMAMLGIPSAHAQDLLPPPEMSKTRINNQMFGISAPTTATWNNSSECGLNQDQDELYCDIAGTTRSDPCYYDILGTTLCVDDQRLLDHNGLDDRVKELLDTMSYEDRLSTLRFQQQFIQWATNATSRTMKAMNQAQTLWQQHTQEAYRLLDDSLNLHPYTNSSSKHDGQDQKQMNSCPSVVFPSSISPFYTSLESAFLSLGDQSQSWLPLYPMQQPWTACLPSQNDNSVESNMEHGNFGNPKRQSIHLSEQALDHYNKTHHQHLLTRLQEEMMEQLEDLEDTTLQEYYQAMNIAPILWTAPLHAHHQLQQHRLQLEKQHGYTLGYATPPLYQELRLSITVSLRQLYERSTQQLMAASKQYHELVMQELEAAIVERDWTNKHELRHLCTMNSHADDITNAIDLERAMQNPSSSYQGHHHQSSSAVMFISQRADWDVEGHRRSVQQQWKAIFKDMNKHSRSIFTTTMDQAQAVECFYVLFDAKCIISIVIASAIIIKFFAALLPLFCF